MVVELRPGLRKHSPSLQDDGLGFDHEAAWFGSLGASLGLLVCKNDPLIGGELESNRPAAHNCRGVATLAGWTPRARAKVDIENETSAARVLATITYWLEPAFIAVEPALRGLTSLGSLQWPGSA